MAERSFYVHVNTQGNDIYNVGNIAIGAASVLSGTKLHVKGDSDTASDFTVRLQNNSGVDYFVARNDGKVGVNNAGLVYTFNVNGATSTLGWISRGYHHINYGNNEIQPGDNRPNITFSNSTDTQVFILGIENDDTFGIFCKGPTAYGFEISRVNANVGFSISPVSNSRATFRGSDATAANYGLQVRDVANNPTLYVKNNGFVGIGADASYPLYVKNNSTVTGITNVAVFDNTAITNIQVQGSSAASVTCADTSGSGNYFSIRADIYYATQTLNYNNNGGITFQLSGVPKLQIASVGNSYNQITSYLPMLIHNGTNYSMIWNTNGYVSVGNAYATCRFDVISPAADAGNSNIVRFNNATLGNIAEFRNNGWVLFANLPTSSAGLPSGALWNNGGVINMV